LNFKRESSDLISFEGFKRKMADKYEKWSDEKHIREKDMWLGSKEVQQRELFIFNHENNIIEKKQVEISMALETCIDEILVNAIDHYTRFPELVSYIKVTFDINNGEISVANDGPGIPVEIHPVEKIYIPEMIATCTKSGSNLSKNSSNEFTGGTNGVGMTLTIICSECSSIETTDKTFNYKQNYRIVEQEVKINNRIVKDPKLIKDTPKIVNKTERMKEMTKITFLPDYKLLGYDKYSKAHGENIYKVIEMRLMQTAIFVNNGKGKTCKVYFNDRHIKTNTLKEFAGLFSNGTEIIQGCWKDANSELNWDVCVIPFNDGSGLNHISIINGIYPRIGGTHITHIKNSILEEIKPKMEKEFKNLGTIRNDMITSNIFIFMKGYISNSKWGEQRKDDLQNKISQFKAYSCVPRFYTELWKILKPKITETFLQKLENEEEKATKKVKGKTYKMYEAAYSAGGPESLKCRLFVPEGLSAELCIVAGLRNPKSGLGNEYNGVFNILGVTVNARKETTITEFVKSSGEIDPETGKPETFKKIHKTPKLAETERLNSLVEILGLDWKATYDFTPKGEEEYKKLNYGCMVLAVDQDLDGMGNIATLLMSFIHLYWPKLYARGFVKRFVTPIIRAFPNDLNKPVLSFYHLIEFEKWKNNLLKELNLNENIIPKTGKNGYEIRYYKGLAGHEDDSIINMFKPENFKNSLYTYCLDSESDELFDVYLGKDTNKRKIVLSTPIDYSKYDHLDYIKRTYPKLKIFSSNLDEMQTQILKGKGKGKLTKVPLQILRIVDDDNVKILNNVKELELKEMSETEALVISASRHLQVETKEYQLDNIDRKLLHICDGLTPSKRKCLAGGRQKFAQNNTICKVFQLGGYIAENMLYGHGDASLSETLFKMGQKFLGAKVFPLFQGISGMGSRRLGSDHHGSPRYISIKLNKILSNCLFPPEDDYILPYKFEDGSRAEPLYYIGVLPYVLMESICQPSSGWRIKMHGLNVFDIIHNVKMLIDPELITTNDKKQTNEKDNTSVSSSGRNKLIKMRYSTDNFKGRITNDGKKYYSVGKYEYNEKTNEVHITELPHRVWIVNYCESIQEKEIVAKICDESDIGNDTISIFIKLRPNSLEKINAAKNVSSCLDKFEVYFELYVSVDEDLNLISPDGVVMEYTNHEDILRDWFVERKELYKKRHNREIELTKLRIRYWENVDRFCSEYKKYKLEEMEENVDNILKDAGYITFHKTKLENPQYLSADNFNEIILTGSYDYLHNLTTREKSYTEPKQARQKKLESLRNYLDSLLNNKNDKFPGMTLWVKELLKLEEVIKIGLTQGWPAANGEKAPKYD
jgi:DNA gyrase/topoisomerase IV subunit B